MAYKPGMPKKAKRRRFLLPAELKRTKASDALWVVLEEDGPMAKKLRAEIDRSRLRRGAIGERVPQEAIFDIERITKGRVKAKWWTVPAVGPAPDVWIFNRRNRPAARRSA